MPDHLPPLTLQPLSVSERDIDALTDRLHDMICAAEEAADVDYRAMVRAEVEHRDSEILWRVHPCSSTETRMEREWDEAHRLTRIHERARQVVDNLAAAQRLLAEAGALLRDNEAAR